MQTVRSITTSMDQSSKALVLFDGVCSICNFAVNFIIDHDPQERFVFAALQSETGRRIQRENNLSFELDPAMVLVEGAWVDSHSTAVLKITRRLRWPWPLLFYLLIRIPRPIRDTGYRFFVRRRYWFGKRDQCRVPTPELRQRFID